MVNLFNLLEKKGYTVRGDSFSGKLIRTSEDNELVLAAISKYPDSTIFEDNGLILYLNAVSAETEIIHNPCVGFTVFETVCTSD